MRRQVGHAIRPSMSLVQNRRSYPWAAAREITPAICSHLHPWYFCPGSRWGHGQQRTIIVKLCNTSSQPWCLFWFGFLVLLDIIWGHIHIVFHTQAASAHVNISGSRAHATISHMIRTDITNNSPCCYYDHCHFNFCLLLLWLWWSLFGCHSEDDGLVALSPGGAGPAPLRAPSPFRGGCATSRGTRSQRLSGRQAVGSLQGGYCRSYREILIKGRCMRSRFKGLPSKAGFSIRLGP